MLVGREPGERVCERVTRHVTWAAVTDVRTRPTCREVSGAAHVAYDNGS